MKMSFAEILRKMIEFDKFKYIYFEKSYIELFNLKPNRPFDSLQLVEGNGVVNANSNLNETGDIKDWKQFWYLYKPRAVCVKLILIS